MGKFIALAGISALADCTYATQPPCATSCASGTRHYGLVAEEVAKVYPELVIRDETGRIDGVRYDELAPMLLNELQKQSAIIADLQQKAARVDELEQRLNGVLRQLQSLELPDGGAEAGR